MKPALSLFGLFVFLVISGCSSNQSAATSASAVNEKEKPKEQTVDSLIVDRSFRPEDSDYVTIERWIVQGDLLIIDVSYSGGCEDHEFKLITGGMYMKSMPPQLGIFLQHNANGDSCRQLIKETLTYDIKGAQYEGYDEVILILNNDRNSRNSYKY